MNLIQPTQHKNTLEEQIKKIGKIAESSLKNEVLEKPLTSSNFETVWRSFKSNLEDFYDYLIKYVTPDHLLSLFKKNQLSADLFFSLVMTFKHAIKEYVYL